MILTKDTVLDMILDGVTAALREKITNGKIIVGGKLDGLAPLAREIANNAAAVVWLAIEENVTQAFHQDLEVQTLLTMLGNRGAKGATLDAKVIDAIKTACENTRNAMANRLERAALREFHEGHGGNPQNYPAHVNTSLAVIARLAKEPK